MDRIEIRVERLVAADPRVVWDVVTDLDHAAQTFGGIEAVERVEGTGYAPGVRWRETRKVMGRSATEEMWVDEVEEPRRTVVRAESRGVRYDSTFTLTPEPGGTRLELVFGGDPVGQGAVARFIGRLMGPLAVKGTRKMLEQDLADIAREAEARGRTGL
ncbi:SRPBCC family protein [Zafaria sp. Z1313]|uniref:SRPBCC family protein n=1 Tax=unclassified Zafaria TaxID=2828765 RepID=UPI002E77637F|nr:SRPBCC family protein [Zafaria sp. J156]MEE1622685.1 SRPBCC family protein [Zafaria sp. J156]